MRLLRLRVLNATTAGSLPFNDALLRWLGLTGAIGILGLVPGIDRYIGLIGAVWLLVLLITTGTDRLRQGLHDKWARSVIVQPAPGGSGLAFAHLPCPHPHLRTRAADRGDRALRRPVARHPDRDRQLGLTMLPMGGAAAGW